MTTEATAGTVEPDATAADTADMPGATGLDLSRSAAGGPGPLMVAPSKAATMARAFSGLMPQTIGEAYILAGYLARSTVVPFSLKGKPESCLAIILAGMEIGLTPMKAVNNITIISGNMAMKADLQLALARASGLLAFHDEGFEYKGQTDTDLAERTRDGKKILQLVKTVPDGKPYGWCTIIRSGQQDQQLKTRVFSFLDADRVTVPKKKKPGEGEDQGNSLDDHEDDSGTRRTLAGQHNYKNWPQSMYPRRARGALLQVEMGDVLAGIASIEQLEGGQVIDADFTGTSVAEGPGDTEDMLMAQIQHENSELATGISAGFDQLTLAPARRLQLLVQYKGKAQDLYDWCRTEYAKRRGAPEAPPKGSGTGKKKNAAPARGAHHPEGQQPPAPAAPATQTNLDVVGTTGGKATTETVVPVAAKDPVQAAKDFAAAVEGKPGGPGARMRDAAVKLQKNRQML